MSRIKYIVFIFLFTLQIPLYANAYETQTLRAFSFLLTGGSGLKTEGVNDSIKFPDYYDNCIVEYRFGYLNYEKRKYDFNKIYWGATTIKNKNDVHFKGVKGFYINEDGDIRDNHYIWWGVGTELRTLNALKYLSSRCPGVSEAEYNKHLNTY